MHPDPTSPALPTSTDWWRDAVDSLGLSAEQDATLWGYLEMAARSMQNRFPDDGGSDLTP